LASLARQAVGSYRLPAAGFLLLLCALPIAYVATKRPLEVLLAVAGLAAVALCTVRIEVAVLLLVASAPLEFVINIGSGSLTITKVVGAVSFGAFTLNAFATRRRLIFDGAHGLVFLLLAISLVSMVHARDLSAAVLTTTRYAGFVALFFVVSQFVGAHELQRRIAWTLSLGSCVTGVWASWNFLSGATSAAYVGPGFGGAGDIAFILATTLPFTMWLLRERGAARVAALAMTAIIVVSVLLTLSRGALVGIGAGLIWYTLFERRNSRALVAGVIVVGLALFLVVRLDRGPIETGLRFKQKVASTNVQTRIEAWDAASRLAAAHPLLGVGPGNFQIYYLDETGRPPGTRTIKVVHNAYLDVGAELGIVALAAFLGYLVLVFTRLSAAIRRGLGPPGFATACRVSLIIAVAAAITLTEQYFAPFWLLGALATAMFHERDRVRAG
jgi:O-antigen ligase